MTDEKYIADVAHTKIFLGLYTLAPDFANDFKENEQETLQRYSLTVDILAVKILTDATMSKKYNAHPEEQGIIDKKKRYPLINLTQQLLASVVLL